MRHLVTLLALLALATPAFARGEKAAEKKAAGGSGSIHIGENLGIQLDGVVRRGKKLEVKGHLWRPGGHALELDGVRRYQMKGTSMIVEKPRLLRTLLHAEKTGSKAVSAQSLKFTATVDPKTGMIDLGRVNGKRVRIKLSGEQMESVQMSDH